MDFFYIKKILMDEYVAAGGKNLTDFVHGMNYLIDYIEERSEETPLNNEVPELLQLKSLSAVLMEKTKRQSTEIKELKHHISELRKVGKQEWIQIRTDKGIKDMEKTYSKMMSKLHKQLNNS